MQAADAVVNNLSNLPAELCFEIAVWSQLRVFRRVVRFDVQLAAAVRLQRWYRLIHHHGNSQLCIGNRVLWRVTRRDAGKSGNQYATAAAPMNEGRSWKLHTLDGAYVTVPSSHIRRLEDWVDGPWGSSVGQSTALAAASRARNAAMQAATGATLVMRSGGQTSQMALAIAAATAASTAAAAATAASTAVAPAATDERSNTQEAGELLMAAQQMQEAIAGHVPPSLLPTQSDGMETALSSNEMSNLVAITAMAATEAANEAVAAASVASTVDCTASLTVTTSTAATAITAVQQVVLAVEALEQAPAESASLAIEAATGALADVNVATQALSSAWEKPYRCCGGGGATLSSHALGKAQAAAEVMRSAVLSSNADALSLLLDIRWGKSNTFAADTELPPEGAVESGAVVIELTTSPASFTHVTMREADSRKDIERSLEQLQCPDVIEAGCKVILVGSKLRDAIACVRPAHFFAFLVLSACLLIAASCSHHARMRGAAKTSLLVNTADGSAYAVGVLAIQHRDDTAAFGAPESPLLLDSLSSHGAAAPLPVSGRRLSQHPIRLGVSEWINNAKPGFCGLTDVRQPNKCRSGSKGAWTLSQEAFSSQRKAVRVCLAMCAECERCRFITVSVKDADCSWYHECNSLSTHYHGFLSGPVVSQTPLEGSSLPVLRADIVVFMHMEKTGGTSVRNAFQAAGWDSPDYCHYSPRDWLRGKLGLSHMSRVPPNNSAYRLFVEHHCNIDWALVPQLQEVSREAQMRYHANVVFRSFTVLRSPTSLAFSQYHYWHCREATEAKAGGLPARVFFGFARELLLFVDPFRRWADPFKMQHNPLPFESQLDGGGFLNLGGAVLNHLRYRTSFGLRYGRPGRACSLPAWKALCTQYTLHRVTKCMQDNDRNETRCSHKLHEKAELEAELLADRAERIDRVVNAPGGCDHLFDLALERLAPLSHVVFLEAAKLSLHHVFSLAKARTDDESMGHANRSPKRASGYDPLHIDKVAADANVCASRVYARLYSRLSSAHQAFDTFAAQEEVGGHQGMDSSKSITYQTRSAGVAKWFGWVREHVQHGL